MIKNSDELVIVGSENCHAPFESNVVPGNWRIECKNRRDIRFPGGGGRYQWTEFTKLLKD